MSAHAVIGFVAKRRWNLIDIVGIATFANFGNQGQWLWAVLALVLGVIVSAVAEAYARATP